MKLDVTQAIRSPGTEYAFSGRQAMAPQEIGGDTIRMEDAVVQGVFFAAEDGSITVDGSLSTVAHAHCANCLAPAQADIRADFRETFIFGGDPEDDEIFAYSASTIDLEKLCMSYAVMSLPMRFLCREDCSGPAGLNDADVNLRLCQKELPGQHPFAALQQLLAEKAGHRDD